MKELSRVAALFQLARWWKAGSGSDINVIRAESGTGDKPALRASREGHTTALPF
jgi:hypothetical protein